MAENYITTVEVAHILRTSPETVRYWRGISYGPKSGKVGRRVLYRESEVRAFAENALNNSAA